MFTLPVFLLIVYGPEWLHLTSGSEIQAFSLLIKREIPVPLLPSTQLLALNEDVILGSRAVISWTWCKHKVPRNTQVEAPVINEQRNQHYVLLPLELLKPLGFLLLANRIIAGWHSVQKPLVSFAAMVLVISVFSLCNTFCKFSVWGVKGSLHCERGWNLPSLDS